MGVVEDVAVAFSVALLCATARSGRLRPAFAGLALALRALALAFVPMFVAVARVFDGPAIKRTPTVPDLRKLDPPPDADMEALDAEAWLRHSFTVEGLFEARDYWHERALKKRGPARDEAVEIGKRVEQRLLALGFTYQQQVPQGLAAARALEARVERAVVAHDQAAARERERKTRDLRMLRAAAKYQQGESLAFCANRAGVTQARMRAYLQEKGLKEHPRPTTEDNLQAMVERLGIVDLKIEEHEGPHGTSLRNATCTMWIDGEPWGIKLTDCTGHEDVLRSLMRHLVALEEKIVEKRHARSEAALTDTPFTMPKMEHLSY